MGYVWFVQVDEPGNRSAQIFLKREKPGVRSSPAARPWRKPTDKEGFQCKD
jgi:hypothetical protein